MFPVRSLHNNSRRNFVHWSGQAHSKDRDARRIGSPDSQQKQVSGISPFRTTSWREARGSESSAQNTPGSSAARSHAAPLSHRRPAAEAILQLEPERPGEAQLL